MVLVNNAVKILD